MYDKKPATIITTSAAVHWQAYFLSSTHLHFQTLLDRDGEIWRVVVSLECKAGCWGFIRQLNGSQEDEVGSVEISLDDTGEPSPDPIRGEIVRMVRGELLPWLKRASARRLHHN